MRGHIKEHGAGAWRIFAEAGKDPVTGKRKKVTRVVRGSRRDAERALAALVAEADRGDHGGTSAKTFGEVIDEYLAHKMLEVESTTEATYRYYAPYLEPLRAIPVNKVGVDQIERLYRQLRQTGRKRDGGPLGSSAIKTIHIVARGALEYARRRRWVAANVALDAVLPIGKSQKPAPTPADSVGQLLRLAGTEHRAFPTYLRVSIAIGARRSEAHGLRWSGVDFERGRIMLNDVVVRGGDGWEIKPRTKSDEARVVAIGAGTVQALRDLHVWAMDFALSCGTTLRRDAFVFSDEPDGARPWNPRTTAKRFSRVCAKAGVTQARLHDLRHLMATHCIDEGVPMPAVSGRLGHADNAITLSIYAGRVPRSDEVAAEVMERLLDGPDN